MLVTRRGGQQEDHLLLSDQPGVGPEDPQQAAHTQTLHTLPREAQAAPYGGKVGPRRQAPRLPLPHGYTKQSVSLYLSGLPTQITK